MKTKNFPARKLARQAKAQGIKVDLSAARAIRTKKDRTKKAKMPA